MQIGIRLVSHKSELSGGLVLNTKALKPNPPNAKNKRPRKEADLLEWQAPLNGLQVEGPRIIQPILAPKLHQNEVQNKQVTVYDVSKGAKSTVKMKAVTESRFILLDDDVGDNQDNILDVAKEIEPATQQGEGPSMVPGTQQKSEPMAT